MQLRSDPEENTEHQAMGRENRKHGGKATHSVKEKYSWEYKDI